MSKRRRKQIPLDPVTAEITALSHEGRGIAHINGKTTFIFGALPNETVRFVYTQCKKNYDEGNCTEVEIPALDRITPKCPHFGVCGGCALQHLDPIAQRSYKETWLLEHFQHQANTTPRILLPPLKADEWGYRRRARLSVRYVHKKERVLIGFRERQSAYVADITRCDILHPSIGRKIEALTQLIMTLEAKTEIAQIEISVGDNASAIIIRNLITLENSDLEKLKDFAKIQGLQCYLQPGNEESIYPLYPEKPDALYYDIPKENIRLYFKPAQFTQINQAMNLKMLDQAIALLDLQLTDSVLDLFCGIGNFSLPITKYAKSVTGIEGSDKAIQQAQENAAHNHIHNAEFYTHDLSQDCEEATWAKKTYTKVLLDPARTGAKEILEKISQWNPERIVYVSCNPITLARDTKILLDQGYQLEKAGIMDMFPHTAHAEAMALFIKLK